MTKTIQVGDVVAEVVQKDIKNTYLSIYPPTGMVRITAPQRMSLEAIRLYAISKLAWIRQQQRKLQEQERETEREYVTGESHYVWGARYLMTVAESDQAPSVRLSHKRMLLTVRPGTEWATRHSVVEDWYRGQVRSALDKLIPKWESLVGVTAGRTHIQRMKTKWGSCNPTSKSIRLNTDLARKPRECLEYVLVHELVHLLESTHSPRFSEHMDRLMPLWRSHRQQLNQLPVRSEKWSY